MKKFYLILFFSIFSCAYLNAQFGYRVLNKKQNSESFIALKYQDFKDNVIEGFGFPDPTNNESIVFSSEEPKGDTTKIGR